MGTPLRHILQQGANLRTLGAVGLAAMGRPPKGPLPELPTPPVERTLAPLPQALVDDFVRWSGGEPKAWQGSVPPTLFPQWAFPLMAPTLGTLPYPLARVVNQGCRITVHQPLPAGQALQVRATLEAVDEQPHKARLHQRIVTGTAEVPEALVCDVFAVVPLGGPRPEGGEQRERPTVPPEARELARLELSSWAGWQFALLTGDFNPIHWLSPYAKVAGFKTVILHGFGSLARSVEVLSTTRWAGDPLKLGEIDVRFTRPLVLPATPGVFLGPGEDGQLSLGEAPGAPAAMLGTFSTR